MAVIQKIRDKYAKLAGFIIALALVGFILMDAASGRFGDLFGQDSSVAKVNGEKIDSKDYAARIQEYEGLYELMGNKIDDNTRAQIHDQVLREMIFEKAVEGQMEDLGIMLTKEEENEMIKGANPDPMVMQFPYFRNQEGQFDPQALQAFETNKLPAGQQYEKAMEQWQTMKNYIKRNRLMQKYNGLFANAVYTPKFIEERQQKDQAYMGGISYVKIPFTSINDNEVKISDADLKSYIEKHKEQYTINDPTRGIDYISFDIKPSGEDTAKAMDALNAAKAEFVTTNDAENYIKRHTDENNAAPSYVSKKTFMSPFADSIMNLPAGSVFGPYFDGGSYKLTKVLSKAVLPDSVKIRHILVKTKDRGMELLADSVASKRLDSAVTAVNSGGNFAEIVGKYSDDPGSKSTAGEYTFTLQQRTTLSKEFADFAFEGKPGEKKTVKVDNDAYAGYHYIEIISQQGMAPSAKIATISKSLFPSDATNNAAYAKATEFAGQNNTAKAFDDAAAKQGYNKLQAQNVKVSDFVISGIGPSREMIRWMYEAKTGEVSQVFTLDGRYIVAKLSNIQDKGLVQLDASNRPMLESLVRSEKKAELIEKKYKDKASLDAVAQASAQPVQNADSFNAASAFVPNLGYEPKVVGYAFFDGLKAGAKSPAIKGSDGVFYISLKYRQQNPASGDPMQMMQQRKMMQMQEKNVIAGLLQESIRRNAEIKYNGKNLY